MTPIQLDELRTLIQSDTPSQQSAQDQSCQKTTLLALLRVRDCPFVGRNML